MPKKPVKYGIKVWMAADSNTGYVSNYDIYLGKPLNGGRGEVGLATNVVLNITEPFQQCNRHTMYLFRQFLHLSEAGGGPPLTWDIFTQTPTRPREEDESRE